jgi:AcrR family transcriptional regulator
MADPDMAKPRGRGRPRKDIQRHVIEDLMKAAEAVLTDKTSHEITLHEIASAANVSEAMIHYYFGGKEGLMVAILDEIMRDAPYKHAKSITQDCITQRSIKPLVERLATFYYSKASLIRMTMAELSTMSSKVRAAYGSRYFDVTPVVVENLMQAMIDEGVYENHFDVKFLASSLFGLIMAPIVILTSTKVLSTEKMDSPEWIDNISSFIDLALKSPKPKGQAAPSLPAA